MGKNQEIMRKIPDGYRLATAEEEKEVFLTGFGLETWKSRVAQYEAQQEAAKLNLRNALSNLQLAAQQRGVLLKKLNVKDEPGYLLTDESQIFILTDPKKKIERLPDPLPKKPEKKGKGAKPVSQDKP